MNTKEDCKQIIETAIKHVGNKVDGIEVMVQGSDIATSRFANNGMTQNQLPITKSISIRVLVNGRQARLSGDQTSKEAICNLADKTIAAAELLAKYPDLLNLDPTIESGQSFPNRFDLDTAQIDPLHRAQAVKEMIDVARQSDLISAGTYSSGTHYTALGNSSGLYVFDEQTHAEASITMRAENASGWAKANSIKASNINPTFLANYAAQKAKLGINPSEITPGAYTVILEPAAVLDLLGYLWYEFSGTSHLDKRSSLLNKLGEKVFGENITIVDDYFHPLQAGLPFDGEGRTRNVVKLIENGIFKNMVYSRKSAKEFGVKPTGHALSEPSVLGELAQNIVIAGGESSLDEMIATTPYGILVTRVWYVREVDPTSLLITGLTQDGTFLIEEGKLKSGIKNMRFNISIHEMLNKVLALGQSVRAAGEEGAPAVVPPLKVADFNFTEHSLF